MKTLALLATFPFQQKHLLESQSEYLNNELLKGHLGITKELLSYHSTHTRYMIGCEEGGQQLLKVCLFY